MKQQDIYWIWHFRMSTGSFYYWISTLRLIREHQWVMRRRLRSRPAKYTVGTPWRAVIWTEGVNWVRERTDGKRWKGLSTSVVLTQGWSCPPRGSLKTSGDICVCHTLGGMAGIIHWVDIRDAVNHSTAHRTAPPQRMIQTKMLIVQSLRNLV